MKVVKSVQNLYNANLAYYKVLKRRTDEIIMSHKDNRWHYESRIKLIESFAMKIETGRFSSTQIFEDFFATTIVVKNLSEINLAEKFISKHFNIKFKKPVSTNFTHKDSYSFPFDDLRLYVTLKDFGTGDLAPNVFELIFEIQIKTFLQHAWSIATHDLIYKSDKINWGKERVAYQVKASLEHAEVTISGVESLSKLSEISKENKEVKKVNQMITMLKQHWSSEDLPQDKRRLAQNINAFIEAIGISLPEINQILITETNSGRGTKTRDLSPYLIVVQSVLNIFPGKIIDYINSTTNRNKQKILLTNELIIPDLGDLNNPKIISLININD